MWERQVLYVIFYHMFSFTLHIIDDVIIDIFL